MKTFKLIILTLISIAFFAGCKKDKSTSGPNLIFKFQFDSTQARLNNFGGDASQMDVGHAGQNPNFNTMSAHYVELARTQWDSLGKGVVLYKGTETTIGGSSAIDFDQETLVGNGGTFFSIPIKDVTPGVYQYLRISLAYQNFDVKLYIDTLDIPAIGPTRINQEFPATVASFVGFNTFVRSYKVKDSTITVNANKLQGYWGFESSLSILGYNYPYVASGQAPVGATTVVNPLFASSPIPAGSCVVTGPFNGSSLKITGNETEDIVVTVSLSTNKSFEWVDVVPDGKWEPLKGETIVDMGLRGLIPYVQY